MKKCLIDLNPGDIIFARDGNREIELYTTLYAYRDSYNSRIRLGIRNDKNKVQFCITRNHRDPYLFCENYTLILDIDKYLEFMYNKILLNFNNKCYFKEYLYLKKFEKEYEEEVFNRT